MQMVKTLQSTTDISAKNENKKQQQIFVWRKTIRC